MVTYYENFIRLSFRVTNSSKRDFLGTSLKLGYCSSLHFFADSVDDNMSALVDMKDACDARVRRFTKLLRRDDPTAYPPSALNTNKSSWTSEVTDALEELVDAIEELCSKNGKTLGPVEISVWKESIKRNEAEFHKFINGMEAKPADIPGPNIGPMVPAPNPAHADSNLIQVQKTRAAQVDIEVDMQIISTNSFHQRF